MATLTTRLRERVNHLHIVMETGNGRFARGIRYLKELFIRIRRDDCQGLAAEMAYAIFVSLIPTLVFLVSLFGLIGQQGNIQALAEPLFERMAPPQAGSLIQDLISTIISGSSQGLTIIGIVAALWAASKSASILIKGMRRACGPPEDWHLPFWKQPLLSVGIVLSLGLMMIVATNLILFGGPLIEQLTALIPTPWNVRGALNLIRWFIILGGLISFTTFVYALILKPRLKTLNLKGSLPGGIAFVVLWIGVSSLFSLYVDKMGTFNPVYGTLGALVLFVTWLYFSTLMLLIGGEIAVMNQDAELKITTRRPPNA